MLHAAHGFDVVSSGPCSRAIVLLGTHAVDINAVFHRASGTSLFGSTRLFAALCKLYNSTLYSPVQPVRPEHIITGPGCGSLLDQLGEHLADCGETFLIAAPYYNGFDADLGTRSQVKCLPVFSPTGDETLASSFHGQGALRGFKQAFQLCTQEGAPARAVLVTNPHNPLGRCYDREALMAYGQFAQQHDLFLVVDEVYALSVFPTSDNPKPEPFVSALSVDWKKEGVDLHRIVVLSSASKDWGGNGLRIGTLITHNEQLRNALKVTAKLNMVASPADCLWSAILTDETFLPWYIQTNRTRLSEAYETIKAWCTEMKLPYIPSNAGHFLMVDMGAYLPRVHDQGAQRMSDEERETELWSLCLQHGVAITPGFNYHHPVKGTFRITFALELDTLVEGLARLQQALSSARKASSQSWGPPLALTSTGDWGPSTGTRIPSTSQVPAGATATLC